METFKVGDRVIATQGVFEGVPVAYPGTIIHVHSSGKIGVEFDYKIPGGHHCGGKGKNGHCRWGRASELELYWDDIPDTELPKEFFYKSRKLSRFLSEFTTAEERCCS